MNNPVLILSELLLLSCLFSKAQDLPYPASREIAGIKVDWSTHQRHAPGSDNFQLTWAEDNHQYGIWGDGGGFAGTNAKHRVSFGVARIEGDLDHYKGYDRYGDKESAEHEAKITGKSWGVICVKGYLYAWVHPDKKGGWGNWADHLASARIYISKDKGASWQPASWSFNQSDGLTGGNILQFGKNYEGAIDDYIYHYFVKPAIPPADTDQITELQVPGEIFLLRVHQDSIMEKKSYEFYSGLQRGKPVWSKNNAGKKPVFIDKNGVGMPIGISYNSGLKRYLLSTEHGKPESGLVGVFVASRPWGPWSTVAYASNADWFGYDNAEVVPKNCFFWCFPTKWMSKDGLSAGMVFTGAGKGQNNDSFNTVSVTFLRP